MINLEVEMKIFFKKNSTVSFISQCIVTIILMTGHQYANANNHNDTKEYELTAENQGDGSILITFDLLVEPELIEIEKMVKLFHILQT